MSLREDIRSAISNAYYENRGAGQTMETAADDAVAAVMEILHPITEVTSLYRNGAPVPPQLMSYNFMVALEKLARMLES